MKETKGIKLTVVLAGLVAGMARAEGGPDLITIHQVSYGGSGCPVGSVTIDAPTDSSELVFGLASFEAAVGDGVPFAARRANCQINLDIDYPEGWQYAVDIISYSGRVALDDDTIATTLASTYFQGQSATKRHKTILGAEDNGDFAVQYVGDDSEASWSPCGETRSLNTNVEVRVSGSEGSISLGNDEEPAAVVLGLKWRRCD